MRGASLPTQAPISQLFRFLRGFDVNDRNLELGESDVDALADHLENIGTFFNSTLPTSEIPDVYLDVFRVLGSAFGLYSRGMKRRVKKLEDRNEGLADQLAQLKLDNDRMAIQQINLTALKSKIVMATEENTKMQKEIENQREAIRRNVINGICRKLNIGIETNDENVLVSEIEKHFRKDEILCNEIVSNFDLPTETTPNNVVSALKTLLKKQKSQHKSELKIAEDELELMRTALERSRAKVERLKTEVSAASKIEDENASMLAAMKRQNRKIRKLSSALSISPEKQNKLSKELNKIMAILDEMSEETARQAAELTEAVHNRDVLVEAVKKLMTVNEELERLYQEAKESPIPVPQREEVPLEPLKMIKNETVQNLWKGNQNIDVKLEETVRIVNSEFEKYEDLIRRMESVIYGQMKFLNLLVSSRDLVASVVLEDNLVNDAICCVKSQIGRTQNFIRKHAMGFVDDPCVFQDLLGKNDTADLMEMLEKYLNDYGEPTTIESQHLFVMFVQAISAGDILRRFAENANQKVLKQASDIKTLQAGIIQAQRECEKKCETISKQWEKKSKAELDKVKSVLRNVVLSGNLPTEILDNVEQVIEIDEKEYIESLQRENAELKTKLSHLAEEKTAILRQAKSDLSHFQKALAGMKRKSEEKANQHRESVSRLETQLQAKDTVIAEMKESSNQLQALNDQLEEELNITKEQHQESEEQRRQVIDSLQQELEETRSDYQHLIDTTKDKTEVNDEELETLHHSLSKLKTKTAAMKTRFEEQKEVLEAKYQESRAEVQRLSSKKRKADKSAKTLLRKLESVRHVSQSLESERNELLKELDNKQRIVKLLESQTKMQILEKEREARDRIESAKSELVDNLQEFLVTVSKMFCEYVDVQQPITIESVLEFLPRVKADVAATPALRRTAEALENVRKQLSVEEIEAIPDEIEDLKEKARGNSELSRVQEHVRELQAWIERMFELCCGGMCSSEELSVMQKRIEEKIYIAIGESDSNHVNLLRTQKQILTSPTCQSVKMPTSKPSFRHAIVSVSFALRVMKVAGYRENVFGMKRNCDVPASPKPQIPVFGQFVIND